MNESTVQQEDICQRCDGKGYYVGRGGLGYACGDCYGTGKVSIALMAKLQGEDFDYTEHVAPESKKTFLPVDRLPNFRLKKPRRKFNDIL